MKYQLIIIISLLLIANACSPKRSKTPINPIPTLMLSQELLQTKVPQFPKIKKSTPRLLLSLERYPCFGKCPVYKIEFFESGTVQYSGKQNTELIGTYSTTINQNELHDLLIYAVNINHFELSSVYPTSGKIIMDVPLTVTYVEYGAEINKIENHHNAPVDLIKFEEHIELLIDNLDWELVN